MTHTAQTNLPHGCARSRKPRPIYQRTWANGCSLRVHRRTGIGGRDHTSRLELTTGGHANAFWQGHDDQLRQVSEWLNRHEVRQKLEGAIETFIEEPFSEELSSALLMLV